MVNPLQTSLVCSVLHICTHEHMEEGTFSKTLLSFEALDARDDSLALPSPVLEFANVLMPFLLLQQLSVLLLFLSL